MQTPQEKKNRKMKNLLRSFLAKNQVGAKLNADLENSFENEQEETVVNSRNQMGPAY